MSHSREPWYEHKYMGSPSSRYNRRCRIENNRNSSFRRDPKRYSPISPPISATYDSYTKRVKPQNSERPFYHSYYHDGTRKHSTSRSPGLEKYRRLTLPPVNRLNYSSSSSSVHRYYDRQFNIDIKASEVSPIHYDSDSSNGSIAAALDNKNVDSFKKKNSLREYKISDHSKTLSNNCSNSPAIYRKNRMPTRPSISPGYMYNTFRSPYSNQRYSHSRSSYTILHESKRNSPPLKSPVPSYSHHKERYCPLYHQKPFNAPSSQHHHEHRRPSYMPPVSKNHLPKRYSLQQYTPTYRNS